MKEMSGAEDFLEDGLEKKLLGKCSDVSAEEFGDGGVGVEWGDDGCVEAVVVFGLRCEYECNEEGGDVELVSIGTCGVHA